MNNVLTWSLLCLLFSAGCSKTSPNGPPLTTAFGSAIVESSGGKQVVPAGMSLPQPVVVQVNDDHGNGVAGAVVEFSGSRSMVFEPARGISDSSGQVSTNVSLASGAGRYEITAATTDSSHKQVVLRLQEIALDYQEELGQTLNIRYCERCHNPESTSERVSNFDSLKVKPHAFSDGDYLNRMNDDDLTAIIAHGGPALNESPEMPPYGFTVSKSDIQALLAYIRAIADPPYRGRYLASAQK
jgi:mono/diheme cytochrome c family protein